MKLRYFCAAAVVLLIGCGKQERSEAVRLATILKAKQADYNAANKTEMDLVARARAWSAGISEKGAGRGADLEKNAAFARELAQSAVDASARLSQLRQAVYDERFQNEYPQSIRTGLIGQITTRQRALQDLRSLLESSAPQFLAYSKIKNYSGDVYPESISKLKSALDAYHAPDDAVSSAMAALKTKYSLADNQF